MQITHSRVWQLGKWAHFYGLSVVVLSYPWLDKEHPDRLGEQLRRLAPFLKAMLEAAKDATEPVTSHLTKSQHSLTATHPICWVVLHWRS